MFSLKKFLSFFFLLILLSAYNIRPAFAGEPVPGAEILIEQEPNDIPKLNGFTNNSGEFSGTIVINPPPAKAVKGIKISIKYPGKILKNLAAKFKKTDHLGTYHFKLIIIIDKKKTEKKFDIEIKNEKDIQNFMVSPSGPYGESLSNIEDNGKLVAPGSAPKKIPFTIKLELTSINNYGINDDGIK